MEQTTENKVNDILKEYEKSQKEFENHPLWRELNTTPQEFFKKVHEIVENSGISKEVWKQKLDEAKQHLKVRIQERSRRYQSYNFKQLTAIKG